MARASRRQAERARREVMLGAIAFVVAIAIAGGAAWAYFSRPADALDAQLCPPGGPTGHYVLLVDKTDPLTFTQKQAFEVRLRELVQHRTPKGYLLSVFVLGESFRDNARPLVELCNPGDGSDRSALTANLARLKHQYDEGFIAPLMNEADALQSATPSPTSPIFEMLQLVGINAFQARGIRGEKRLIVMSDMLHNTTQFTMYRGQPDFGEFARSDYGRRVQAQLPGVDVELDMLMNTPQRQTRRQLKFWEDYFDKAGARIVLVEPLEG
jgi:hypothetical protein